MLNTFWAKNQKRCRRRRFLIFFALFGKKLPKNTSKTVSEFGFRNFGEKNQLFLRKKVVKNKPSGLLRKRDKHFPRRSYFSERGCLTILKIGVGGVFNTSKTETALEKHWFGTLYSSIRCYGIRDINGGPSNHGVLKKHSKN